MKTAKGLTDRPMLDLDQAYVIINILNDSLTTTSLNRKVSDGINAHELGDTIADTTNAAVEDIVVTAQIKEMMNYALSNLTPRERDVLECIFVHNITLPEIGKRHGVTRQRIWQIKAKALKKLRQPKTAEKLEGLL